MKNTKMKPTYPNKKKQSFDKLYIGLILGLLIPLISFYVFFLIKNTSLTFGKFVEYLGNSGVIPQSVTLGVIPNLLIFFIFIWTHRYLSARGVIVATMIYTVVILAVKYM